MAIEDFRRYFIVVGLFCLLKIYSYFYIYKKIKYHDDGSCYVSRAEFFCLHVTYSVFHGWISFFFLHSAFQGIGMHYYDQQFMETLGCLSLMLLMIENCIYISYFKDIIFSLEVCAFYLGIFYKQDSYPALRKWGQTLMVISLVFVIITLAHSWKSCFYTKYSYYLKLLQDVDENEHHSSRKSKIDKNIWLKETFREDYESGRGTILRFKDISETGNQEESRSFSITDSNRSS